MIKILIADDHAIVRAGLKQILAEVSDMVVVGEAGSGQEALEKVRNDGYDVIVLDISMPGKSGLDVLKELKRDDPQLAVLVLSMHPEDQYAVRFLKAGADGYLTKEGAPDELVSAIRKVSRGRKYVSSSLAETLAYVVERDIDRPPHETLSDREYQVMCMIAQGKALKDIAEELYLSPKTISTYRARLLDKMQMKNNAELTHYAIKHGLVD